MPLALFSPSSLTVLLCVGVIGAAGAAILCTGVTGRAGEMVAQISMWLLRRSSLEIVV